MSERWRIFVICSVAPIANVFVDALRGHGHEPVALLGPRRGEGDHKPPPQFELTNETAPAGLDLLLARDKHAIEPLVRAYAPDLLMCWGFPWKIPAAALETPRLGSVNLHPALLPRHRGPIPLSWALRDGDRTFGTSWHYMDAELDTGNLLAQGTIPIDDDDTDIEQFAPKLFDLALGLLPRALERVAAGDPGDPQPTEGASWAGHFEDDAYVHVDWSQTAREIHDQVRAWRLEFGFAGIRAPVADLGGERVVLLRTRLTDPGGDARRVECGDAPLWIVESEPA
jgi:methionyl-tRNA formyltransferase